MSFPARKFVIFLVILTVISIFFSFIYKIFLAPLLFSSLIAYIMMPTIKKLEQKKVPRWVSSLIIVSAGITLVILSTITLVPLLYKQLIELGNLLVTSLSSWKQNYLPIIKDFLIHKHLLRPKDLDLLIAKFDFYERLTSSLQNNLWFFLGMAPKLLGGALTEITVPILSFLFMKDFPTIKKHLITLVPIDLMPYCRVLLARIEVVLRSVIQGQIIVAFILGICYCLGFSIIDLESAVVIGVIAGICRVIPYLDIVVGMTLSFIVLSANFQGWLQVIQLVSVFLVVQTLDGLIITPKIIGGRVGLHPLIVVISIIAFGSVFGFIGVLLAIPMIATAKVAFNYFLPIYLNSSFYRETLKKIDINHAE